jgi:RNA polymerase sigma-70 factor (ECF subfamily)
MTMQRDDMAIFSEWLREHRGVFFKVVRAYGFTPQDREDLFQEIAIQVWRSVPSFRGDSSVATWIYRVALNVAISWIRREKKHSDGKRPFDEMPPALLGQQHAHDPRLEWLYDQIAQLDELDRSLTLLLLDGFSYSDMASLLGIGESNVGVRINRIKARLIKQAGKERVHEI